MAPVRTATRSCGRAAHCRGPRDGLGGPVMQLLEKDPARRPADGLVLLRQLQRIKARLDRKQAHETIIPGPVVTLKPELDPAVRHPGLTTLPGEGPATIASR